MQYSNQPIGAYMTYDDHGYADDMNITTDTLANLQIQIYKLYPFIKYTSLELETTKCEVTCALWGYENPMNKESTNILRSQINTIKVEEGIPIRYLPL